MIVSRPGIAVNGICGPGWGTSLLGDGLSDASPAVLTRLYDAEVPISQRIPLGRRAGVKMDGHAARDAGDYLGLIPSISLVVGSDPKGRALLLRARGTDLPFPMDPRAATQSGLTM